MFRYYIGINYNGEPVEIQIDEKLLNLTPEEHAKIVIDQIILLNEIRIYEFDGEMKLRNVIKRN